MRWYLSNNPEIPEVENRAFFKRFLSGSMEYPKAVLKSHFSKFVRLKTAIYNGKSLKIDSETSASEKSTSIRDVFLNTVFLILT